MKNRKLRIGDDDILAEMLRQAKANAEALKNKKPEVVKPKEESPVSNPKKEPPVSNPKNDKDYNYKMHWSKNLFEPDLEANIKVDWKRLIKDPVMRDKTDEQKAIAFYNGIRGLRQELLRGAKKIVSSTGKERGFSKEFDDDALVKASVYRDIDLSSLNQNSSLEDLRKAFFFVAGFYDKIPAHNQFSEMEDYKRFPSEATYGVDKDGNRVITGENKLEYLDTYLQNPYKDIMQVSGKNGVGQVYKVNKLGKTYYLQIVNIDKRNSNDERNWEVQYTINGEATVYYDTLPRFAKMTGTTDTEILGAKPFFVPPEKRHGQQSNEDHYRITPQLVQRYYIPLNEATYNSEDFASDDKQLGKKNPFEDEILALPHMGKARAKKLAEDLELEGFTLDPEVNPDSADIYTGKRLSFDKNGERTREGVDFYQDKIGRAFEAHCLAREVTKKEYEEFLKQHSKDIKELRTLVAKAEAEQAKEEDKERAKRAKEAQAEARRKAQEYYDNRNKRFANQFKKRPLTEEEEFERDDIEERAANAPIISPEPQRRTNKFGVDMGMNEEDYSTIDEDAEENSVRDALDIFTPNDKPTRGQIFKTKEKSTPTDELFDKLLNKSANNSNQYSQEMINKLISNSDKVSYYGAADKPSDYSGDKVDPVKKLTIKTSYNLKKPPFISRERGSDYFEADNSFDFSKPIEERTPSDNASPYSYLGEQKYVETKTEDSPEEVIAEVMNLCGYSKEEIEDYILMYKQGDADEVRAELMSELDGCNLNEKQISRAKQLLNTI